MKTCFAEFVAARFLGCVQIDVNMKPGQSGPATTQEVSFERVKAFSKEGDHCVQAGRDVFVLNQLKRGAWLGYEHMRDAALSAVQKYMAFRNLHELTGVSLHYRDLVAIPRATGSGIDLEDWFRVYPKIPEASFGGMSAFTFAGQLPSMCENAITVLSVQSLPAAGEGELEFKFSIDWHVHSANGIKDLEAAKQWLDRAHDALDNSFEKALAPKCLELFEPNQGD